jgi:hypothetical protein
MQIGQIEVEHHGIGSRDFEKRIAIRRICRDEKMLHARIAFQQAL